MKNTRFVQSWLLLIIFMIFAMVIIGGATRLTDSGLSITEWAPLLGAIPPMSHADWNEAFDKYRLSSQFKLQNHQMTMPEFQFIYWWEWAHRFVGRALGLVVLVPLIYFAIRRSLPKGMWLRLFILGLLVGAQGALGWYMVASGLVDRVSVSQYRLSAHLTAAAILFAYAIWTYLSFIKPRSGKLSKWAVFIVALIFAQIAAGGLVAGLDAGMGYNTWPLMDGALVPSGLGIMQPWWLNSFENAMTVQFNHRLLAYILFGLVCFNFWRDRSAPVATLFALMLVQIGLGIATLLLQVPLFLALAHQGTAMLLLGAVVWNLHKKQ